MVVLAIITSLFVAVQDPIIQKFAVRFAGGYLSEKTGADIKVGRLAVTPDFRILIDDVSVKDLRNNDLATIGALRTKIDLADLLEDRIHLENVILRDTEANLITYKGENQLNFAFLLDAFPSDTTKEKESKPMAIIIDRISLKNIDFMLWNQNTADSMKTERGLMDYSHLVLEDISLEANDFYMLGDSIRANIGKLSAKEISGLELKSFKTDAVVCSKGIFLDGLLMETNNSRFDMDLNMLYNDMTAFGQFVDSVVFNATIRPSDVMLSDIGVFTEVMYKMPDRVQFEGRFSGPIQHFRVDDIKAELGRSTSFQGNISIHPLDFENGYHTLNIKNMRFNYDDLVNFYIPSSSKTIPLPESMRPMGDSRLSLDFKGSYNNFTTTISLLSGLGDIDAAVARRRDNKGDNVFSGNINANRVKAGLVANAKKFVGDLDLTADFSAKFPKKGEPEFRLDGNAYRAELLGNLIDIIKLDGEMKENRFNGQVTVDDDHLFLDFDGLIDFSNPKYPKSDFEAVIRHADLHALNLLNEDSISQINTTVRVNLTGFNIDDLEGEVLIDSTLYTNSKGDFRMKSFSASIGNDNLMGRKINLDCDFFSFLMAGKMNFASIVPIFKEYVDTYMNIPLWDKELADFEKFKKKNQTEQDFVFDLTLKDTRTISRLLMPSLKIAKNTSLKGTFTSRTQSLNLTLRSKNVQLGDLNFNNLELKNFNFMTAATTAFTLDEIVYSNISETDTTVFGVDNLSIVTRMTNDTVFATIKWDDDHEEDHNKALIKTYFHPHQKGGIFSITEADVSINDSVWTVSPFNYLDLSDGRTTLSNLMFSHNQQFIRFDGYVPMKEGDTLSLMMRQFDLSNLDIFLVSKGFDLDGFISGDALVSSLKTNPMLFANLDIQQLAVNHDKVGDVTIGSSWNNENKSVELEVNIFDEQKKMLDVTGAYYTERKTDNLDFVVALDSLQLNVLSPFLTGVVSRMQGLGLGQIAVTGSLQQPEIQGRLSIKDGGCKIGYLNTFYTFSPTILIDNNTISFENMVLTDTLGNTAMVEGEINHKKLKDFNLNLKMHPRDFLALATTSKDNNTFYGSAVANGLVRVTGPFNDIKLFIDAQTRRGTNLTIPLNKSTVVKDNDFIVFVEKKNVDEEEEEEVEIKEVKKSKFGMKLNVNATDDAELKIILPGKLGTIEAAGNGNVQMNTATSEDFTMFGDYTIKSGRFQLTLIDLVTRSFNLKSGGTLSWSGDPTKGRINATGSYILRAPLTGLGIQIDSTVTNTNVNVECLIHLKGDLLNPSITFGMNLPNATDDVNHTVFSVVDTTNQAAMTTQALSLLVLGSFSYAGGEGFNIVNILGTTMQFDITNNLNMGMRFQSGNGNSYDEYQMSLRTELFENRLSIETNLGMMTANSPNAGNASSIVGEFDMYYKLTRDGRLQAHFYNHSNYTTNFNSVAFDKRSPYTQGLGLSYSRSFTTFRDLFRKRNVALPNQPLIQHKKKKTN